jgi:hypothetical protein
MKFNTKWNIAFFGFMAFMVFLVTYGIPAMVYWSIYSPISEKELAKQNATCVAAKGELIVERARRGRYMGQIYEAHCRYDEIFERYKGPVDTP